MRHTSLIAAVVALVAAAPAAADTQIAEVDHPAPPISPRGDRLA